MPLRTTPALTALRLPSLWWVRALLAVALVGNSLAGAVAVFVFGAFVVPLPAVDHSASLRLHNLQFAAIFLGCALLVGGVRWIVIARGITRWLREGREPDEAERRAVLRAPGRVFLLQAGIWGVATIVFGLFNARHSVPLGLVVAGVVGLSGLSTSAFGYLLTERIMRPLARIALQSGVPRQLGMRLGVRTVLAWMLSSGVLMIGVLAAGLTPLVFDHTDTSLKRLAITMVVMGGTALVVGGLFTAIAARAASDPIRTLRSAIDNVGRGRLDTRVPIYDGTEVGILQAGFNDMVDGLREREQIRDLFGRHVGDDVARAALAGGVALGGEVRRVAVLFVDIIGSTALAHDRPPEEVVTLLNRFFDVVIDVVHEHDGWINKFEGDAALAIWGAPEPLAGAECAVLRAGRVLGERLRTELPEVRAGIGISAGQAVAGNVGAAQRYEYTVIGDPVNEAARLTELAKDQPSLVLANAALLDSAPEEAAHWQRLAPVTVRGRSSQTVTATPLPR